MRVAGIATLVVVVAACSGAAVRPGDVGKHATAMTAADRAALVLPPVAETRAALQRLAALADKNDVEAAWARLHYLVDLFDEARVFRREADKALLLEVLGVGGAPSPTDAVLDALLVAADRLLAADRLHAGALAARTLLERDRHPPTTREALFPRVVAVKSIARGAGPLAANALLRLHDMCAQALADAAVAPPVERVERMNVCLYPLYDADPAIYFSPDPARRPPEPAWRDFAEGLSALAEELGRSGSRLSPAGGSLIAEDKELIARIGVALPVRPDAQALRVPRATGGEAYRFTPLLTLGDGGKPSGEHAEALGRLVAADGRGRVTVALGAEARGEAIVDAAGTLLKATATTLELGVAVEQKVRSVAGDYWQARLPSDQTLVGLAVLPIALDELAGPAQASSAGSERPRASEWDPARAPLRLHLVVGTGEWQLVAGGGAFPAVPVAEDGVAGTEALRAQLRQLRRAFPDEGGLLVVVKPGVSVRAVAQALVAARGEAGARLFPVLALAPAAPVMGAKGELWERVQRRAKADVGLPEDLASRVPAVRACWLEAVDRGLPAGSFLLEADGQGARVIEGPADPALRQCVVGRIGSALAGRSSKRARVELTR
jgi:hypothetical protein